MENQKKIPSRIHTLDEPFNDIPGSFEILVAGIPSDINYSPKYGLSFLLSGSYSQLKCDYVAYTMRMVDKDELLKSMEKAVRKERMVIVFGGLSSNCSYIQVYNLKMRGFSSFPGDGIGNIGLAHYIDRITDPEYQGMDKILTPKHKR